MQLPRRSYRLLIAGGLAVLLAAIAALPGDRSAHAIVVIEPQVQINPGSGSPDADVVVSGRGFVPSTSVFVHFIQGAVDEVVAATTIGEDGTFTTTAAVPSDAVPGFAQFVAANDVVAGADFFVGGTSAPIGDQGSNELGECELVLILVRVRNRIGTVAGEDRLNIFALASGDGARIEFNDTFVRGEWTTVSKIVGRWTRKKNAFPVHASVLAVVDLKGTASTAAPQGAGSMIRLVDCPDTELFQFIENRDADGNLVSDDSLEVRTNSNDLLGNVDMEFKLIVRPLRAQ